MANGEIQNYADMFNLQVAAEAFLKNATTDSLLIDKLTVGNENNSKETLALIDTLFKSHAGINNGLPRYQLVAHIDLTLNADHTIANANEKSGFSGTIFYDTANNKYIFNT